MSLVASAPVVRLGVYAGILLVVAVAERVWPRRSATVARHRRWPGNLMIAALGALLVRVLVPTALVGVAAMAQGRGWGLLNVVALPRGLAVAVSIVLLDLTIYAQHFAFHKIVPLWRVHRMHHTDLDVDVTSGARFHPAEILASTGIKAAAVIALGAPAAAVLAFEVLLNASSMFNHGNVRIPPAVDRLLRRVLVTPDMHRVHHSVDRAETDSNFGFNLPWWDRLFGTYRTQPALGHDGMTLGQPEFRGGGESRLDRLLLQPLRSGREGPR